MGTWTGTRAGMNKRPLSVSADKGVSVRDWVNSANNEHFTPFVASAQREG